MTRKCICEICNCGRHHCPHMPTGFHDKTLQPCLLTEYHEKYPSYGDIKPRENYKPKPEILSKRDKMEGTSTFRTDYIPHEITQRPQPTQHDYRPKSGEMDHHTTYKVDFSPHKIKPAKSIRPPQSKPGKGGRIDTVPTYKDDYRLWDIPKRKPKPMEPYCPPTSRFGNPSTFQDDFGPKGNVLRESFKPPDAPRVSDVPFDGLTNHKIAYVPHPLGERYVRPPDEYKPSDIPFDSITTHRRDFRGLHGDPTKSFKPDPGKIGSDAPFDGNSEFRDRFQAWPITLPYVHKHPDYVQPEGPMDLNSTSHLDYVGYKVKPPTPFKPALTRRVHAPFQGSTTMKDDFKTWDVKKPEIIKRVEEIGIPNAKFDGLTTFKSNYVPHPIKPTHSFKPSDTPLQSSIPFDAGTLYRTEYTPKRLEICPASYPTPPGYVYESTDARGHKFFHKMTPSEEKLAVSNEMHLPKEVAVAS
ncbi:stabilizer of axonemal microtubules 2 [Stegostoma tigrinum]|uniref:stabilizer of axonemal microtubules 2 n=1 Tax=Stegostoma tigrinum TaxID=3053191 RepID=UPI00202B230D|nr:stabilizer of axonemal microtubules 2 [Stegostoma tigrinum]